MGDRPTWSAGMHILLALFDGGRETFTSLFFVRFCIASTGGRIGAISAMVSSCHFIIIVLYNKGNFKMTDTVTTSRDVLYLLCAYIR